MHIAHTDMEIQRHVDDIVQDCSISIADTLEIRQSCPKPAIYDGYNAYVTQF